MNAPLTVEETLQFEALQELLATDPENKYYALVRSQLDGEDVAVVVAIRPTGDDTTDVVLFPIAVLLNENLYPRLTPPS